MPTALTIGEVVASPRFVESVALLLNWKLGRPDCPLPSSAAVIGLPPLPSEPTLGRPPATVTGPPVTVFLPKQTTRHPEVRSAPLESLADPMVLTCGALALALAPVTVLPGA